VPPLLHRLQCLQRIGLRGDQRLDLACDRGRCGFGGGMQLRLQVAFAPETAIGGDGGRIQTEADTLEPYGIGARQRRQRRGRRRPGRPRWRCRAGDREQRQQQRAG
jgi:hypothetical protein